MCVELPPYKICNPPSSHLPFLFCFLLRHRHPFLLGEPSLMHSLNFQRKALSSPSLILRVSLRFSSPFLLQDIVVLGLMELEKQLHRHNPLDQLPLRIRLQVHQLQSRPRVMGPEPS